MPNWCTNNVTLHGPSDAIAKAKELLSDRHNPFTLDSIIPMPEEYKGVPSPNHDKELAARLTEKYGHPDWYSWAVYNWGTKWDVEAHIIDETADLIHYNFETAWAPPFPVIEALSERFPDIHIVLEYDEPGMDFWGITQYFQGDIISEIEGLSRQNEEAMLEDFVDELEIEEDVPDEDF